MGDPTCGLLSVRVYRHRERDGGVDRRGAVGGLEPPASAGVAGDGGVHMRVQVRVVGVDDPLVDDGVATSRIDARALNPGSVLAGRHLAPDVCDLSVALHSIENRVDRVARKAELTEQGHFDNCPELDDEEV